MNTPARIASVVAVLCIAGCATVEANEVDQVGDTVVGILDVCLDTVSSEPVRLIASVHRGRLRVEHVRGLTLLEERCVRGSLSAAVVPRSLAGLRLRFRLTRNPDPHATRTFLLSRREAIAACRPCALTRIVATPIGDRYVLSAELVGDEPPLERHERSCILTALDGMPGASREDTREIVVVVAGIEPSCTPR